MYKILISTILFFALGESYCQEITRFYYNSEWEICDKESSEFYRDVAFDTESMKFDGSFTDYNSDGQLISKGLYSNGVKNGIFIFFDSSANKYCEGKMQNDIPEGIWTYFYPEGNIRCTINFSGDEFKIIEFMDENSTSLLPDGTGSFEFTYINDFYSDNSQFIKGELENGLRTGKWKLYDEVGIIAKQKYVNDEYRSSTITFTNLFYHDKRINFINNSLVYEHNNLTLNESGNKRPLRNSFFIPFMIYKAEAYVFSNHATQEDYPFFPLLPQSGDIPATGIYMDSIIYVLETQPKYPGGQEGLRKYIGIRMRYPIEAILNNSTGIVYVEITIDTNGAVIQAKAREDNKPALESEAERVALTIGKFKPGTYRGKKIITKVILPFRFNKIEYKRH